MKPSARGVCSLFSSAIALVSVLSGFALAQTPPPLLAQGGFEVPVLPAGTSQATPPPSTGTLWAFGGRSGIAANGSTINAGNPPAPEGNQIAYVTGGTGTAISQSFTATSGRHVITSKAAQRIQAGTADTQTVSVQIDGLEIQRLSPTRGSYAVYQSQSFKLTTGLHTIRLVGQDATGTQTMLIDDVAVTPITSLGKLWSDPTAWAGGKVPTSSTLANIPAGITILLDGAGITKELQIDGTLYCLDKDLSLDSASIMVHGRLECGSEVSPHVSQLTITLSGLMGPHDPATMGYRVIGAMQSGIIELHGEQRVSWTQLSSTASAGTTVLQLTSSVDWRPLDQIVVAPSREQIAEGEVATIQSVNGSQVTLTAPLSYTHWGQTQDFSNPTTTWTLDERAEVGLLTRNIKIQGDGTSTTAGNGGHMMTMDTSVVHASGIELYLMGQKSLLGRYPFHWHLLGNAPGQYIKNSSIHDSFNRCVTVHGTNDTLVADNVCYNFIGHGYFLEDGYEERNVFDHNLGVLARKPRRCPTVDPNTFVFPAPFPCEAVPSPHLKDTDWRGGSASNGPAVFWIGHPNNTYTNNAAAGSGGTGFWYGMQDVVGPSSAAKFNVPPTYNPRFQTFGVFNNNRAHSNNQGFSSCRDGGGAPGMEPPNEALIQNLTATNNLQGVWPCAGPMHIQNARFTNMIVANSPNEMQAPNPMTFQNSVFIGYSNNAPAAAQPNAGSHWRAIQNYDQGYSLENVHFVNYDRPGMAAFVPGLGAHKHAKNRATGLTFSNAPNLFRDPYDFSAPANGPTGWGDVIHDIDGKFAGAGWALVSDFPIMYDSTCTKPVVYPGTTNREIVDGYACPARYGRLLTEHGTTIGPVTVMRSDGYYSTAPAIGARVVTETSVNSKYIYTWRYTAGLQFKTLDVELSGAWDQDTAIYELLDMPSTVLITTPGWSAAVDVNDLKAGVGHRYLYKDHSLFLKMKASGTTWQALDLVNVCLFPASGCSPGVRTGFLLPSVTITAPRDGMRFASGASFTVQATSPNNVSSMKLYLGEKFIGTDTAAPYQWTLTGTNDGSYPLKVVVETTTGETYTAVQQLFVGEPSTGRVDITSIRDGQTYNLNAMPQIVFTLANWPMTAGGKHLNLLVDDVDRGAYYTTAPITLPALAQGKHKIELALTTATGTITAISDRATIYALPLNIVADFEDGVDQRATWTADNASLIRSLKSLDYFWGSPDTAAGHGDGEDDVNFFSLSSDGTANSSATFELRLDPLQNWTSYQKIVIVAATGPMEVLLVDSVGVERSLGNWKATTGISLSPAAAGLSNVSAVRLRYPEPAGPAGTASDQVVYGISVQ